MRNGYYFGGVTALFVIRQIWKRYTFISLIKVVPIKFFLDAL